MKYVGIDDDLVLDASQVVHNPDDIWFIEYLAPYYIITKDYQYLFDSTQAGRRPDRVGVEGVIAFSFSDALAP